MRKERIPIETGIDIDAKKENESRRYPFSHLCEFLLRRSCFHRVRNGSLLKQGLTTYMRKRNGSHAVTPFRIYANSSFVAKAATSGTRPETGLDIDAKKKGNPRRHPSSLL